jgi:hypothetical protein
MIYGDDQATNAQAMPLASITQLLYIPSLIEFLKRDFRCGGAVRLLPGGTRRTTDGAARPGCARAA